MHIIEVLARKRKGLLREEIVKFSNIPDGGGLTGILADLELCGFVSTKNNFHTLKNNKIYQLTDFYSLFYIHFLKDRLITDKNFWTNTLNTPLHNSWAGFSFELLCQSHIEQIRKKLGISGVITYTSAWQNRHEDDGVQIDLIIDRNDNVINVCEIKFSRKEFLITKDEDQNLRTKAWTFAEKTHTKKAVHITMITTYGVKRNEYRGTVQSEVVLDDLFSY